MRVSKGWRDYLAKLPRLWMHLDLSGARKPVPRSFVDKAVRRSKNRLTRMTIHRFEHVDVLKNIAIVCKGLAEVEIITLPHAMSFTLVDIVQRAPNLKRFVVRPMVTVDTVTQILRYRPNLEQLDFGAVDQSRHNATWHGPFPNLKAFSMHFADSRSSYRIAMQALLSQTSILQSISVSNMFFHWSTFSDLPLTSLILKRVKIDGDRFPRLPTTLQRLVLEYESTVALDGVAPTLVDSQVPKLHRLSLAGVSMLSADRFEDLLDSYHTIDETGLKHAKPSMDAVPLQSLAVHGVLADQSHGLFRDTNSLFGRSPRILTTALEVLDISMLPCNDDEIEHLLTYKTGLTSIDVSNTHITGASIKMLSEKLSTLRSIRADNCPRINGRDAIEYARRKGIAVSCSMVEQKGGRKIRYG
jgi:F-box/TPR repeat protein Pof3